MIDLTPRLAETYHGPIGYGASLPQKFSVQDIGMCAVKFTQNTQGPRVPINEIVGFCIADLLGIKHPPVGIVEIPAIVLPDDGILKVNDGKDEFQYKSGLHFYSKWLDPSNRVILDDFKELTLKNPEMLAGVVLLDLLINNFDRKTGNMNLLLHREPSGHYLNLIDLSMAFGNAIWTLGNLHEDSLPSISERLPYSGNLDAILATIKLEDDFSPYIDRLKDLKVSVLEEIVYSLPKEWSINDTEKQALLEYILNRVKALPNYLEERFKKDEWWL